MHLPFRLTRGAADSEIDQERVGSFLAAIWTALTMERVVKRVAPSAWRLDLGAASVARLDRAWLCPQTWRLLPYAPGGVSLNAVQGAAAAEPVAMPRPPIAAPGGVSGLEREALRRWLVADPQVSDLRRRGLWTDLHDRVAEFSPFLRAQEHSAQIDPQQSPDLRGGVPRRADQHPQLLHHHGDGRRHPRRRCGGEHQRAALAGELSLAGWSGRARGEPWALSFTFCKDLPLDRMIFRDPDRLLRGEVRAPSVQLDSAVVVQRHVNALLLGMHLRGQGGIAVTTAIGAVFGATDRPDEPCQSGNPAEGFLLALQGDWVAGEPVRAALAQLAAGTVLANSDKLALRAEQAFETMLRRWRSEYEQILAAQAAYPEGDPTQGFYRNRARRMQTEFMMAELARRGFTPSYGFPVHVVSFEHVGTNKFRGSVAPAGNRDPRLFPRLGGGDRRPRSPLGRHLADLGQPQGSGIGGGPAHALGLLQLRRFRRLATVGDGLRAMRRGGAAAGDAATVGLSRHADTARSEATLHGLQAMPKVGGLPVLAEIGSGGSRFAFASGAPHAAEIGRRWGEVAEQPILRGADPGTAIGPALSAPKLRDMARVTASMTQSRRTSTVRSRNSAQPSGRKSRKCGRRWQQRSGGSWGRHTATDICARH